MAPGSAGGGGDSQQVRAATVAILVIFSGGLGICVWGFRGSGEGLDHVELARA